jgi:hypothetical protein
MAQLGLVSLLDPPRLLLGTTATPFAGVALILGTAHLELELGISLGLPGFCAKESPIYVHMLRGRTFKF